MTRALATLITITATLAAGLAIYKMGPWTYEFVEALTPLVRLAVGAGTLVVITLALDHRRARQWRRHMDHLDAIGHAVWRDRAARRRTGS